MHVAIIPARAGSKGVVDKNIFPLWGISLIGIAAQCAIKSGIFDSVIISTDSEQYAAEALKYNCINPYLRPESLSTDTTLINDVIINLIENVKGADKWETITLLEPTCPLRTPTMLQEAFSILNNSAHLDACFGVDEVPRKYNPIKQFLVEEGHLIHATKHGGKIINRQALPPSYIRNGLCYMIKKSSFIKYNSLVDGNVAPYITKQKLVNIDTPEDINALLEYEKNNKKPDWLL